jgi:hypothetical protein
VDTSSTCIEVGERKGRRDTSYHYAHSQNFVFLLARKSTEIFVICAFTKVRVSRSRCAMQQQSSTLAVHEVILQIHAPFRKETMHGKSTETERKSNNRSREAQSKPLAYSGSQSMCKLCICGDSLLCEMTPLNLIEYILCRNQTNGSCTK